MYDPFKKAYNQGKRAGKRGKSLDANPYKPSGHERDTTFDDECHYQWYPGWIDAETDEPEKAQ